MVEFSRNPHRQPIDSHINHKQMFRMKTSRRKEWTKDVFSRNPQRVANKTFKQTDFKKEFTQTDETNFISWPFLSGSVEKNEREYTERMKVKKLRRTWEKI